METFWVIVSFIIVFSSVYEWTCGAKKDEDSAGLLKAATDEPEKLGFTSSSWKRHEYADFIANSPTDIDWLIQEVERLREERKNYRRTPMTRLTDERIAEIEAKLASYGFKDSLGHPLTNCKDFQGLLAEVKTLKAEKSQAEAERDVLITLLNSGQCPYSYGYEFPDCVHITEEEESHCMGYSATKYSCWLKYAQQQADKEGV